MSEQRPIRVVVAEDHPVVQRGICSVLAESKTVEVIGTAGSGSEALTLARELVPDVLLLDIEMPEGSGVEVARTLREQNSPVRIVALSSHTDDAYVEGLLESGAAGYLTKEQVPYLIIEAVESVARGETRWFVRPSSWNPAREALSERERQVLRLMAEGCSNREIAQTLHITERTVRNHASRLYDKLGVHSAREAIAWAWRQGLVE